MTAEWGYAVRDLAAADDFDDEVKRATAALTADRCSNPYCRALTSGPTNDRRAEAVAVVNDVLAVGIAVAVVLAAILGAPELATKVFRAARRAVRR